jgi:hypothetical protein
MLLSLRIIAKKEPKKGMNHLKAIVSSESCLALFFFFLHDLSDLLIPRKH